MEYSGEVEFPDLIKLEYVSVTAAWSGDVASLY